MVKPKFPQTTEEKKVKLNTQIICRSDQFNPSGKENPFELSDDTCHERSKFSHHKMMKYSTVTEMV